MWPVATDRSNRFAVSVDGGVGEYRTKGWGDHHHGCDEQVFPETNMPVVPSQYWSIAHGTEPGEVTQDEEGMQTMRQLALNMAFMIKAIRLGLQQFGSPKIQESLVETHYIR